MKIGTVLLVDDNSINRVMFKSLLNDICYVVQASGGNEALNIMLKMDSPPDLIILDLLMFGISGFEFMALLREIQNFADIPVIVVTSLTEGEYKAGAKKLGAVDFITRPYNPEIFKQSVKKNIELSKLGVKKSSHEQKENSLTGSETGEDKNYGYESMLDILAGIGSCVKTKDILSWTKKRNQLYRGRAQALVQNMLKRNKYSRTLKEQNFELIIKAAPLNDIGKIGIPESILLKSARLTTEEFENVKRHTEVGADIITRMIKTGGESDYLNICYDICRFHHERWDGRGYPLGLLAELIPLPARISSLLDVYDALTRERPYKSANTHSEAIDIIEAGGGSQFDPYITGCFLEIQNQLFSLGVVL